MRGLPTVSKKVPVVSQAEPNPAKAHSVDHSPIHTPRKTVGKAPYAGQERSSLNWLKRQRADAKAISTGPGSFK
jgi:hypothetical protein